jgi:uncharacterized protein YjiS (DUF1127 family)
MEAIVARDGLAGSSLVLHHVGHPGYRKLLRIPMTMQLHQKAREQQDLRRLDRDRLGDLGK